MPEALARRPATRLAFYPCIYDGRHINGTGRITDHGTHPDHRHIPRHRPRSRRRAHREGHEVIATARDVSALDDVPAALRLGLDVTDQASVDAAIARAGRVDVLVSNAGMTVRAPLETIPLEAVREIIELNTLGALRVAQAVLPGMRAQGSGQLIFSRAFRGGWSSR